jgi:hypothetical protein
MTSIFQGKPSKNTAEETVYRLLLLVLTGLLFYPEDGGDVFFEDN